ncbi:Type II secretory pathway, component PulF [Flavobacterium sp. 9AF]|uniref:type II secretion system F family protein n=1 Tax=Flavobacterium sp. 9AF TaxID=2653142 RepID=UPI0012F013DB|nr:type II secretion system F family protein [Flavobacterium sp. 9AF]VXB36789.1 Type II secretory pathway, component PulF [Flavobacterium sp. 9AF]
MAFKIENTTPTAKDNSNSFQKILETEITLFSKPFSSKRKYSFYLEMSVLLKAGITLKEALGLTIENIKNKKDKAILEKILDNIINGKSFSDSIYEAKSFSDYEYYSLKIGEETGNVAKVTEQLAYFFERKNEQKRVVIAALTYPAIILSTALLVIIFMLSYVVPMFQDIFKQNNIQLPWITEIIISLSDFVKNYGSYFLIGFIIFLISFNSFKKNKTFKSILHRITIKIPIFGSFIKKVYLAQFTQAVSLLTSSKIPILNSIQLVNKMIDFIPLQEDLTKVEQDILKGFSLHESLKKGTFFDNKMTSLVKVAEETNQTDFVFKQLNDQYNLEVAQQSKIMSTLLEPFIILIVGLIVAILLVAMYLPMFQLSNAIG